MLKELKGEKGLRDEIKTTIEDDENVEVEADNLFEAREAEEFVTVEENNEKEDNFEEEIGKVN